MAIDGPPENIMTIGKLHWSLGTGTPFSASVSKKLPALFCRISTGIIVFRRKIATVNLNSQEKFYDKGASAVLRRLTAVLPAILEK